MGNEQKIIIENEEEFISFLKDWSGSDYVTIDITEKNYVPIGYPIGKDFYIHPDEKKKLD